jgi:hypothetical protein
MVWQHLAKMLVLFVPTYVTFGSGCNQSVQWSIMSYSTLIILRIISGTMFMLTKMTKMPSEVMLTKL